MKKAYVFPGQGSQFEGMGKAQYESSKVARRLFEQANEILGWRITDVMFAGTKEALMQTQVTQPAVFLESYVRARIAGRRFQPDAVAGHSLGEFTALVAAGALRFEDGLRLVSQRAIAMQKACERADTTMAAVLGLEDAVIERICSEHTEEEIVVPANYNSPGQLVISGSRRGIELLTPVLQAAGAKRVVVLPVGGAFHSPFMQPAQDELATAISHTRFRAPKCPIYQNIHAQPETDPKIIQKNLIAQLTSPVRWTQTIERMAADGIEQYVEVGGAGAVLRGMIRKILPQASTDAL